MKIHFFALFSACLFSLLSMDRTVAMEVPGAQSQEPSPDTRSVDSNTVDSVTNGLAMSIDGSLNHVQLPVHPSFSARYRLQHQPSHTVLDEAFVLYSDRGLRVEQLIDHSANVFMVNHAEEKFWFIDRQRQLVHAIPVIVTRNEPGVSAHPVTQHSTGFVKLSPCSGLDGKRGATELWQGRSVQHWTCLFNGDLVEEQWYAPSPGVVVRSSTTDGFVSELTDLRQRETSTHNFQPPSHYRHVSIEELMDPAMPIGSYAE